MHTAMVCRWQEIEKSLCLLRKKVSSHGPGCGPSTVRAKKKIIDEHYRFIDVFTGGTGTAAFAGCLGMFLRPIITHSVDALQSSRGTCLPLRWSVL